MKRLWLLAFGLLLPGNLCAGIPTGVFVMIQRLSHLSPCYYHVVAILLLCYCHLIAIFCN